MKRDRETYLKFKPMADDLRQAESWCDLDGVLNRMKTMQNLYKMGYRKQKRGEWKNGVTGYICSVCGNQEATNRYSFCPNCGANMKGGME